jgi:thymidylate kinase
MDKKLVKISTIPGLLNAELIKMFLEAKGIECLVSQESAGKTLGLTVDGLGSAKIYVREDQEKEAEELLAALDRGEFELPEEGNNSSADDVTEAE